MRMSPAQHKLYQRIQHFSFDAGPIPYPFHLRLARENGWSKGYCAKAITEYRRFTLLAACSGHPVGPSDPVDQVWHLHLLHTESYWERFCANTLHMPLHQNERYRRVNNQCYWVVDKPWRS